jgi:crotonobetainyl-CoA:carnitine CoA-transferase CaiB-like acyl-CoA transferase
MDGFFDGLTVVEVADRRSQYAGKLLSDGGARVIQVEPPSGSPGRWCGPFVDDKPDPDRCLDYWYYNAGKQSVCIDLERPAGRSLVARLAAQADIVLVCAPPATAQTWGLDYTTLAAATGERILYLAITDFGLSGPWQDYLANDVAHLALGGQMASSGYSDPTVPPIAGQGHQAWHIAGVLAIQALSVALIDRLDTGRGQLLDCAIHDCCAICTELAVPYWIYLGEVLYRLTGQHAGTRRLADQTLPCADGVYVNTIATGLSQYHWVNLMQWMREEGVAGELDDPMYMDEAFRAERFRTGSEIREGFARLLRKVTAEEAMRRAQSFGLAWSVVRAPEENYYEPHWHERGYFAPVEYPGLPRPVRYPSRLFQSETVPMHPRNRAPLLGEHTLPVLGGMLGLKEDELRSLLQAGVIGAGA